MFAFLAVVAAAAVTLGGASRARAIDTPSADTVARGRYIVRQVGMCTDCHGLTLMGGKLAVTWRPDVAAAELAPKIAGLPGYTAEGAVRFLETGIARNGKNLRPPMPAYRLKPDDAAAVVAYLRSLQP
ncbi:MAG: cytochrome c [Candidatus Baltobacteraceae bacterium]